ncbi:MAG: transposase [Magnetococcales bacterium]|nr:transposase [Magnetococcales bacterium]
MESNQETSKIHAATDALGNPLQYILTGGQEADITQAHALIEGMDPELVIAIMDMTQITSWKPLKPREQSQLFLLEAMV